MKRTAENQLTKDTSENEDDIEEGKSGFQKADADSLAARKIRALPKRPPSTAVAGPSSSQPTNTDSTSIGGSRFVGFGGFGATPSNKDDIKGSFPSFIGFGPTKAPSFSANIPSSSGPPASVAFQNISTSMTPGTDDNTPRPPTPAHNPTLTKYYTDLRALNISFSRAVNDAIEADPFVDLSVITEKYRTFREGIQKERDSNDAKQTSKTTTLTSFSTPSTTVPAFTAPAFPSTTFTFGSSSNPNPAPQTTASAPSTTKGQSWSKSLTSSTDKTSTPSFSFGTSSQPSSSGFFVFGGSSTEGASGSKAATTTTTTTAAPDKPTGSPTTQNLFKLQSTPITPGFSSFLTPSSSLTTTSSNSQPSTSIKSESSSSSSTGNLFGAANKGNMGNPLGFSFGNTPKFPAFPSTTTTVSTTIGTGTETTTSNGLLDAPTKDEGSTEGDESASENAQTDNNNKENQYDRDGAGEEEEETQFETKSKAYMNVTTADGKKAWSPVGTGQLKLKKQKEGTKRRLLMRNSSNGKVIINTLIVPGFKLTAEGKTISFIVPNAEGTADFWKLRLSTESDAKAWEAKISEEMM